MKNLKKLTALLMVLSLSPISLVFAVDDEPVEDYSDFLADEAGEEDGGGEYPLFAEEEEALPEAPSAPAPVPASAAKSVTPTAAPKAAVNKKNKKNRKRRAQRNRRLRARRAKAQARKAGFGPAASRKKLAAANRKNAADSLRKELE
jgi:hypothetical protein